MLRGVEQERIAAPFTQEMQLAVSRWYFNHYRTHWMADGFRVALASIPQVGTPGFDLLPPSLPSQSDILVSLPL